MEDERNEDCVDYQATRKVIFKKLDNHLQFRDPSLQNEFREFCTIRKMRNIFMVFALYCFFILAPSCLLTFPYVHSWSQIAYSSSYFILAVCSSAVGGLLYFEQRLQLMKRPSINSIVNCMFITLVACCILWNAYREVFSDCSELPQSFASYLQGWRCNRNESTRAFIFSALSLYPIAIMLILKDVRFFLIITISCIANILFCVLTVGINQEKTYLFDVIAISLFQYFVCYELHIYRLIIFLTYRKLKETLAENKRMEEENRAIEFRCMIGNLAHDLKTPLTSFITGIDMLADNLNTIEDNMLKMICNKTLLCHQQQQPVETMITIDPETMMTSAMKEALHCAKECFLTIRNTNLFMLMTINRCIDYTKASKGLKLTPKYETIGLLDTLQLPLGCMKNLQTQIEIEMLSIDETKICPMIITDKQWLQENLLCLLSNAVKYSTHGPVTISITIITRGTVKATSPTNVLNTINQEGEDIEQGYDRLKNIDNEHAAAVREEGGEEEENMILEEVITPKQSLRKYQKQPTTASIISSPSARSRSRKIIPVMMMMMKNEDSLVPLHNKNNNNHSNHTMRTRSSISSLSRLSVSQEQQQQQSQQQSSMIEYLRFEVADHGIGLSEEKRIQLFAPFQQVQRLAGGTGLGLYSLAKRIEALKGDYGVHSRSDHCQGSVFWFEIPYRPDSNPGYLSSSSTQQELFPTLFSSNIVTMTASNNPNYPINRLPSSSQSYSILPYYPSLSKSLSTSSPPSYSILLVDDSVTIIKMVSLSLKRHGHQVISAENGEIAVEKFFQFQQSPSAQEKEDIKGGFDVILIDIQMPIMDGLEATRRLRTWEKEERKLLTHQQIIIGMSANSDVEAIEEAYQAGVNDFISKPFHIDVFEMKMHNLMLLQPQKQQ